MHFEYIQTPLWVPPKNTFSTLPTLPSQLWTLSLSLCPSLPSLSVSLSLFPNQSQWVCFDSLLPSSYQMSFQLGWEFLSTLPSLSCGGGGISCPSPHSMLWGGEGFPVHHPPLCWGWDFLSTFPPSIMGGWDFLSTFPHPCSASIPLSLCRPVQLSQLPGVLMRICLVISRKTVSLKSPTSFLLEVPSLRGGVCYLGLTLWVSLLHNNLFRDWDIQPYREAKEDCKQLKTAPESPWNRANSLGLSLPGWAAKVGSPSKAGQAAKNNT